MSRQPSYPKDAAVGGEPAGADKEGGRGAPAPASEGSKRTKHLVAGAAIGIGSAAIVAALLYSKRRKGDR